MVGLRSAGHNVPFNKCVIFTSPNNFIVNEGVSFIYKCLIWKWHDQVMLETNTNADM